MTPIEIKYYDPKIHYPDLGKVGTDWMPYEIVLNFLFKSVNTTGWAGQKGTVCWLSGELLFKAYLNSDNKLSTGSNAIKNWIITDYFKANHNKKSVLKEIEYSLLSAPDNFVKWNNWYHQVLYKQQKFHSENGEFTLKFTPAAIVNIVKVMSNSVSQNAKFDIWIDYVNWEITEIREAWYKAPYQWRGQGGSQVTSPTKTQQNTEEYWKI